MEPLAGNDLWTLVKLGLRLRGTTLDAWCEAHGVNRRVARSACLGERNGLQARRLRRRLANAAGVAAMAELQQQAPKAV